MYYVYFARTDTRTFAIRSCRVFTNYKYISLLAIQCHFHNYNKPNGGTYSFAEKKENNEKKDSKNKTYYFIFPSVFYFNGILGVLCRQCGIDCNTLLFVFAFLPYRDTPYQQPATSIQLSDNSDKVCATTHIHSHWAQLHTSSDNEIEIS